MFASRICFVNSIHRLLISLYSSDNCIAASDIILMSILSYLFIVVLAYKTCWLLHRGNYGFGVWFDYPKVSEMVFFTIAIAL